MPNTAAARSIRRSLLNFFAFEPEEVRPTLLLTLYLLLAIASVIALKAASTSLFLTRFSASQLPFGYVAIALLAGLVVSLYIKLSILLPQTSLVIYTQLFFASHLFLFWWILRVHQSWLPALLYVWTGVYAAVIPSQVWTLANHIFTTRQAKRLFSLIGSGGILGAVLGGLFSSTLARWKGTQSVLLACVVFLVACSCIVYAIGRTASGGSARTQRSNPSNFAESLRTIGGSRYLTLIAMLVVLSAVLNNLVDYQFKFIVRQEISNRDELTAFLGSFAGYMACFGFLMQLILTSRIMRWFGLNFAIFILPVSMVIGSGVLLVSAHLFAASLLRGFDQAFRHSVDRSSVELLYVPLPVRVKQQAKAFIDVVASRWADGLGGVLLLLLATTFHLSMRQFGWVNLAIVGPWLTLAWMVRREYVNELRSSIERKDISAEVLLAEMAGSSPEKLTTVLSSSDERAVETGLGLLQHGQVNVAYAQLASLLTHLSPTIRRKAMGIILDKNVPDCSDQVRRFLYLDDRVESLWQALDYLEREERGRFEAIIEELLESPYPVLRATAAARVLVRAKGASLAKAGEILTAFVAAARDQEPAVRAQAAELLGLVPAGLGCQSALSHFLADPDPRVKRAAVVSAGRSRQEDLLPRLLDLTADRRMRTEVRHALAAFGPAMLPALSEALLDSERPPRVRLSLPRIFSSIGGQEAANALVKNLDHGDSRLQYQVLRALGRIRRKEPEVRFDAEEIHPRIVQEMRKYYQCFSAERHLPQGNAPPSGLFLRRAVNEQRGRRLEVVFRLAALIYPAKDILDAYYGVASGRRDLRANALEFLDSTLQNPIRQMLLPALENRDPERVIEASRVLFGIAIRGYPEALRMLLEESDPWLQSCAVFAAADSGPAGIGAMIESLQGSEDPLLRETVAVAQQKLGQNGRQAGALWNP